MMALRLMLFGIMLLAFGQGSAQTALPKSSYPFVQWQKNNIQPLTTYRPLFALSLVALLVNAFVIKQLHYVLEQNHSHGHHLVNHHAHCGSNAHFHTEELEPDCSICDFRFSPRETISLSFPPITPPVFYSFLPVFKTEYLIRYSGTSASLRGPPNCFS